MMFELIKYDVLNGKRRQFKEMKGTVFATNEQMCAFRNKIQAEYPDYEVYLTYREIGNPIHATA